MMSFDQCFRRSVFVLVIIFVCVSCTCVFSKESAKETSVVNKKLSISSEEYDRRQKIVNSYLSNHYESKKDWLETYDFIYAREGSKYTKQSSTTEKDKVDDVDNKAKFDEHLELLKYELKMVKEFSNFSANNSNSHSDMNPEAFDFNQDIKPLTNDSEEIVIKKDLSKPVEAIDENETRTTEKFHTFHSVKIDKNIQPIIANEKEKIYKSDAPQPVETGKILNKLPSIEKSQTSDENIQLIINGMEIEVKKTDFLQLVEKDNILSQLCDLKKVHTLNTVEGDENMKPIINNGDKKLTKTDSSSSVKDDKISKDLSDKFLVDDELAKRHKIVDSYLSKLGSTDDWVETYAHNFQLRKSNDYSLHTMKFPQKIFNVNSEEVVKGVENFFSIPHGADTNPERFYMNRWLKKLLNKFHDVEYKPITISLDTQSVDNLKQLSENFDIVSADEFFCSLISNSTVNYSFSWFSHFSSNIHIVLIIPIIITVMYAFVFNKICRPLTFFFLLILLVCFGLQGYKRYQTSIAMKQATVSSTPPYCESFVTENSGVFDIVKDVFRKYWYHEDCKKYFAAIMIDPISDVNPLVIIMETIVETIFQVFRSLAPLLNYFVKELFYDTSVTQQAFITVFLVLFVLCCLYIVTLCFNYKIRLPYFFASLEPTIPPVGSQVQDLNISRGLFSNISARLAQNDKTNLNKDNADLPVIQKEPITHVDGTISTKPVISMNIHNEHACIKAYKHEEVCTYEVVITSDKSRRQPSISPPSSVKQDEKCIHDSANSSHKNVSEPDFPVVSNELVSNKGKEAYNDEVIISDESKRDPSSCLPSPIKTIKKYISHSVNSPDEKAPGHSFHSDAVNETSYSSVESTMCSESVYQPKTS